MGMQIQVWVELVVELMLIPV
jgi:hypothetical protein